MKTINEMAVSRKMQKGIEKVEKRYGKCNKTFGIEAIESNRVGRGYYDYCQITCDILKSINIIVAHDGTINW